MDTLYLDNIDEYVHDQDKIVTYKWLSLTLGVHVNTAKRMLFHYLEHKRKESSASLHATYLLSGKSDDHGRTCHKVSVVREEELEDAKSRLSAVVSVHVYSVHKALLRDSAPLFGVDYDAVKSNLQQCNRYSAIRCPDAVPLSNAQSRESRQPPPPAAETPKPQTPGSNLSTKTCPKPKGIMGIFTSKPKTETRPETETETETRPETKQEEPVTETKPAPKANAMANFFGSQTTKKPVVVVVKEESSSTEQRPPQTSRDQRSKSKRGAESDDEGAEPKEKKKKRRRRVQRPEDSSDEEQEVIPDSPVQTKVEPSPEPIREEPAPPQTENSSTKIRKRRRVLKSKTFLDEEGCIVTEKGYVSESYSETEEEVQTKSGPNPGPKPGSKPVSVKAPTEEKKKGVSGAKNTKQASIMGFFNKK